MPNAAASDLLLQAAAAAAGGQQYRPGSLYVVATPIGNLADIGLRALHVLARVDAVAAEDTRVAGRLLHALGLHKPLLALHAHNERAAADGVLTRLAAGESVALISDAGTPAVSDPGAWLVAAATAAGRRVVPIPGPSSALAALCAAGDAVAGTDSPPGFSFVGFLPAKGSEREAALRNALAQRQATILFEAPHRIAMLLAELAAAQPARRVTLARELTKQFEQIHSDRADALPGWLAADADRGRGEFVLVLHAQRHVALAVDALPAEAARVLAILLRGLPVKQAAALAAEISGQPRKRLYAAALALKGTAGRTDAEP
jgi:16S rRNA (cytidine1402-2'-O)-methyltransferase